MSVFNRLQRLLCIIACSCIVQISYGQSLITSIEKKFERYKNSAPKERILIITDRDVYAPGELIWLHLSAHDIFYPRISDLSKELSIILTDHESRQLLTKNYTLELGKASGFVQLPKDMKDGIYYLQGNTRNSGNSKYYFKKIAIKEKILPQFLIKASFEEAKSIPGDLLTMNLEFMDFYNEPLRGVEYHVDFFEGIKKIPGANGKTNKTGKAILNVKIPSKIVSGMLTYSVSAKARQKTANLMGRIPVLSDQIYIDFYPENGKIMHAIKTLVSFYAYDAAGEPLTIEADLFEDGKVLSTFTSTSDGLGKFQITSDVEKSYHVQIKRPLLLEKTYGLPKVHSNGIAINEISKNSDKVSYKLINGYKSTRTVYLLGVANGEIFWTSEHQLDREEIIDMDISKVDGPWAHILVLNSTEDIEGELMLYVPLKKVTEIEINQIVGSKSIRGKMEYEIVTSGETNGVVIFTSVNSPWSMRRLHNQEIWELSMPSDLRSHIVFQSNAFHSMNYNNEALQKYKEYYVPVVFSWEKILSSPAAFSLPKENQHVTKNLSVVDLYKASYTQESSGGITYQVNMILDDYFAKSNPSFFRKLYEQKTEKIPAYKTMLENGTPVMDVLQVVKPYNLQGNDIVFVGGARSINYQGGALIVIDGINRGTDASALANLSPYDIEEMRASTNPSDIQRYTGLNVVGLVEVTLKKGGEFREEEEELNENMKFTAPEYKIEQRKGLDDFRSTLWWATVDIQSPDKKVNVSYYNAELFSSVGCRIYFIPEYGCPVSKELTYTIK